MEEKKDCQRINRQHLLSAKSLRLIAIAVIIMILCQCFDYPIHAYAYLMNTICTIGLTLAIPHRKIKLSPFTFLVQDPAIMISLFYLFPF